MIEYEDLNGVKVKLSFERGEFSLPSRHVLVIASWQDKWLLTEHFVRGVEFPGGKCEDGETIEAAARREVLEETGAKIGELQWFAEYIVEAENAFCKTVFLSSVEKLQKTFQPLETKGAILLTMDELINHPKKSFHMKDDVMDQILRNLSNIQKT